ncbi:retrovirus-related pol polyprotein from transposon TNT 1-94 [Tanacetum coccineum]
MMLLARAITQHYSTPTNNRLHTSLNTKNRAVIHDGRVDIQSKNIGYVRNVNQNAGRQNRYLVATAGNGMVQQMEANDQTIQRASRIESNPGKPNIQCYNCNARGHYACDCPQPKVRDSKFFREQLLLALKDEVGGNLKEEENDFMLDNYYGDESLEELNAAVIMMARIQPIDDTGATSSRSDVDIRSEVNASTKHNKSRMPSKSVHEQKNHVKLKTVINTSDDDQIDSSIIFDDLYLENNGGEDDHDSITHEQYVAFQSLIENVQNEAQNERSMNNELKKQQALLQKELETFKERLHDECVQQEYATLRIRNETELSKKAFKERENSYLEEIVDLTEQLMSYDQIVLKMGQSIQTIHMLAKKPNKVYDPFLKAGLGYQNPERLKKAIKAQPKMYNGDSLHSTKLEIDSLDSKETLENAEESRLKMKDKMIQLNYEKLNAFYETFVPQTEFPVEQTYLSYASTSNVSSESSAEMSDLPVKKMPNESKLLNLFVKLEKTIGQLQTGIDETLLKDRSIALIFDDQDELRQFYKTGVIPMSINLRICSNEKKQEIKEEVNEMFDIFESMEEKVEKQSQTDKKIQNEINRLLETSLTREIRDCVFLFVEKHKNELLILEIERISRDSKDIQTTMEKRIKILENYFKRPEAQYMTKLINKNVLLKNQVESTIQERENIKLEYQKLFNSIKATRVQHQQEVKNLIEDYNQKTYAYDDVRAKNQYLFIVISELKEKLAKQAKNMNTKFDKSATLEKPVCVTPLNKNKDLKAKTVSKVEIKTDRSKPVTSCPTTKSGQTQKTNTNVIARGMYRITKIGTQMPTDKANNTSKDVKKSQSSFISVANKRDTLNSNACDSKTNVLKAKTVNVVLDGSNLKCVSYGKDVFLMSHDKCVARYALLLNSRIKRALFTSLVAEKSSKLEATPVVAKSRFSVATPPKSNK